MIELTDRAAVEIKRLLGAQSNPDLVMRLGIKGGGCSGLSYTLNFDSEIREHDQVFDVDGIKVVVDRKSLLYLEDTTLDYTEGLAGRGFTFINPNATRTCGCGSSFSV